MIDMWKSWGARVLVLSGGCLSMGCGSPEERVSEEALGSRQRAVSTVYEAEAAELLGGAVVATDHAGYSGAGFVGGFTEQNRGTAAVKFTVQAPTAGRFDVTLRYANGSGGPETVSLAFNGLAFNGLAFNGLAFNGLAFNGLAFNGLAYQLTLEPTAHWETWGTRTDTVELNAGPNTLGYAFDTADSGNILLDGITLTEHVTP